jgi:hypothetical protein
MNKYRISNRTSGLVLGVYEGYTAEDAIETMAVAAGYMSSLEAAAATAQTLAAYWADLLVIVPA